MKARIEVPENIHVSCERRLVRAAIQAVRKLVDNGGSGTSERSPHRYVYVYTFDGPAELVRPVIAALMECIRG